MLIGQLGRMGFSAALLALVSACASTRRGGSDNPVTTAPGCAGVALSSPVPVLDPDAVQPGSSVFVWTAQGPIGVGRGAGGMGYRVLALDPAGKPRGPAATLWPAVQSMSSPRIAIAGDVIAIVDQVSEGVNSRQTCRLGLARLSDLSSIQPPARFSDPPDDASILNEASECNVTRVGGDVLAVWQQNTSSTSPASSLFGQRYAVDGTSIGNRITFTSASDVPKLSALAVTSDEARAVIAYSMMTPSTPSSSLAFVETDQVRTVPLDFGGTFRIASAHGGFVLDNGQQTVFLDRDGRLVVGPVETSPSSLIAPLGEAWVSVSHEEFLVATALDGQLVPSSPPTGLSTDRGASAQQLLFAPDGTSTAALFSDSTGRYLAQLVCSSEAGAPPGPSACPAEPSVQPLDDGCTDAVCHAAIRLDYLTLGLRGYASVGGPLSPVDGTAAMAAAQAVFDASGQSQYGQPDVVPAQAGVFRISVSPMDFGAFALVGANSGLVITAGGVVWSGRGSYWAPAEWKPPEALQCGSARAEPQTIFVDAGDCPSYIGPVTAPPPSDALDVALRTNLAQHYAAQGSFSAFVYLYTPTVGACDPGVAEYIVVLTR